MLQPNLLGSYHVYGSKFCLSPEEKASGVVGRNPWPGRGFVPVSRGAHARTARQREGGERTTPRWPARPERAQQH